MKQKTLIILAAAAVATTALAAVTLSHRDARTAPEAEARDAQDPDAEAFFPGLIDHINDVQTVSVKRKDGTVTLRKTGSEWGMAEKDGFPIEMEPVRKMLIGMAEMKRLEPKTSDPARYDQIGVQDPDAEGSKSALITLTDSSGKDLAKLILGQERESKGAALSNQRFVRKPGEAQSWLVQGTFDVKEKPSDWLEKKILEVKRDRVRTVEITQPDGELLVVDRPDAKTNDFKMLEIPEGKELTYPTAPGSVASGLEYVNLEDVQPVDKIDFLANPGPSAKFKTFDGLVVTVTTKDQDGKTWAKFDASYEAPPPEPAEAPKADATAAQAALATDPAKPPEAPKTDATPAKKAPEEVQKEAADIEARVSKWAYEISPYTKANLGKKKSELLKDKTPPPAPVDPNAPKDPNAAKDPNAPQQGSVVLPSDIPPEIQEQIKAHQASLGNKVTTTPFKPDVAPTDSTKPDASKPDSTPAPAGTPPASTPPAGTSPVTTPPHDAPATPPQTGKPASTPTEKPADKPADTPPH